MLTIVIFNGSNFRSSLCPLVGDSLEHLIVEEERGAAEAGPLLEAQALKPTVMFSQKEKWNTLLPSAEAVG